MKRLQIRGIVQGKKNTAMLDRCVAVTCRNVVDLFNVYLPTRYLSLVIKQQFRQNTMDQVGTDSSNRFLGICLNENFKLLIGALFFFIDLVITFHCPLN